MTLIPDDGSAEASAQGRPSPSEPTLQTAWNLYKTNWQPYVLVQLTILAIAVVFAMITGLTTLISKALTGSLGDGGSTAAEGMQLLLNFPFQLVYQVVVGLLVVLIFAFPALHYATGHHSSYAEGMALLKHKFWRYLLAGLLYNMAAIVIALPMVVLGFVFIAIWAIIPENLLFFKYVLAGVGVAILVMPYLVLGIIYPIYVRRVFTSGQDILQAFLASFRDLFSSGYGWGLVGYELLAGLLVLISALFCLVPLFVTYPLAAIFIQQYLVSRGLGEPSEA